MAKKLDLDGKTWIKNSISIWGDIRKSKEERKIKHPAIFPSMLVERLVRCFSHEGDTVLDPFMGSGSTIIGACLQNRKAIGLELYDDYVDLTEERIKQYDNHIEFKYKIGKYDAMKLSKLLEDYKQGIDLCITSPPYWDILTQKRSAYDRIKSNYGGHSSDLGNINDYGQYLEMLKKSFEEIYKVLNENKFCIVIVMDLRKGKVFYPLHMDLSNLMIEIGYSLEDIVIWDRRTEYNFLRPLGFPYVFRINKIHEYIMIFRK